MSKTKPPVFTKKPARPSADEWVAGSVPPAASVPPAPMRPATPIVPAPALKRLTIDLPADLHQRFKLSCVRRGTKMVDEIRDFLETRSRI